jgi:hypothetical protein
MMEKVPMAELDKLNDEFQQVNNEIDRLAQYLLINHPDEIGKGNPVHGESAVDIAIRLLSK